MGKQINVDYKGMCNTYQTILGDMVGVNCNHISNINIDLWSCQSF